MKTPPDTYRSAYAAREAALTTNRLADAALEEADRALAAAHLAFSGGTYGGGRFCQTADDDFAARVRIREAKNALAVAQAAQREASAAYAAAVVSFERIVESLGLAVAS